MHTCRLCFSENVFSELRYHGMFCFTIDAPDTMTYSWQIASPIGYFANQAVPFPSEYKIKSISCCMASIMLFLKIYGTSLQHTSIRKETLKCRLLLFREVLTAKGKR
jgi:hypothetical protein